MKDPFVVLGQYEEFREVLYHLRDIVRSRETILERLTELASSYHRDDEATAEVLSLLEVEVSDHLGYHVREIKKPLRDLVTAAFEALGPEEDEDA